jgi:hypothetical protein
MLTIEYARITEADIERYMMTTLGGSPPLDILIRSSGVKRLSDFLMWQVSSDIPSTPGHPVAHNFFVGVRERTASLHSYVLAGYWVLGLATRYPGLSSESVDPARGQLGIRPVGEPRDRVWYVPGL